MTTASSLARIVLIMAAVVAQGWLSPVVAAEPADDQKDEKDQRDANDGKDEEAEIPVFGEEMVVTATRTEKRLADVPVHMEVVDRREIEATASRTLADAVEWTPGLRVESNCQNCNFSQIRMLGLAGPYSQILIDGQPTVSSLALVYGIEQLPARLIDGIEVVKGGGSAVYGGGAVAGVINLIPHQPSATGGAAGLRYGTTGGEPTSSLSGVADWSPPNGRKAFTAYGQLDRVEPADVDGDGFTEVARRRLEAAGLRWERWSLADRGRWTVEATRIAEERRGGDRLHLPPHEAAIAEAISTERLGASATWVHSVSSRFDYRLAASFADTHRDSYYGAGFDPDAYGETENPLGIVDAQLNHYRDRGTLTWGLQATRDDLTDVQLGRGRSTEEVYDAVGLYAQDDRKLGSRASLLWGARVDRHSEVDDPIVSPRLALMWTPRTDLNLRASLSSGFRPPVVFDEDLHIILVGGGEVQVVRNHPDLREERSRSAMLGLEWLPDVGTRGSAVVELALFHTGLDGLFNRQEDDDPATPEIELTRANFGDARVWGAELVLGLRLAAGLTAEIGWVEQRARFGSPEPDFGSRDFFRTPERHGMATLQWTIPRVDTDLFLGAAWTGPMKAPHYAGFIAEDRLETTPSFLTYDANLSRRFDFGQRGGSFRVMVGGKNLTDEYQEDLDRGPARDAAYVYGPRLPRSVFAGIEVDL